MACAEDKRNSLICSGEDDSDVDDNCVCQKKEIRSYEISMVTGSTRAASIDSGIGNQLAILILYIRKHKKRKKTWDC